MLICVVFSLDFAFSFDVGMWLGLCDLLLQYPKQEVLRNNAATTSFFPVFARTRLMLYFPRKGGEERMPVRCK